VKATEAKFLEFLKKSPQFVIPIYQRTYSRAERECRQLWDDNPAHGRQGCHRGPFRRLYYLHREGAYQVSSQSPLLIIDGQQRLTTVMLILEALAQHMGDEVGLSRPEELSYVMGLVRQAFEKQMGNGEAEA
jgi:uncharacterized protein with ParB-like and HNH nuclease domain